MIDVDKRTELVNVFVSVAVESVGTVETSEAAGASGGSRLARKVVVTIDQDYGGLIGDDLSSSAASRLEAKGAGHLFTLKHVEFGVTSGVRIPSFRFPRHLNEFLLRNAMLVA